MSAPPLPGPPKPSQVARRPAPRAAVRAPAWGWLEWFLLVQALIPALLFVPGLSAVRVVSRVAVYALAPLAWFFIAQHSRQLPGARSFPARTWLLFCMGWLALLIFHPNSYSFLAALAQAVIYISIMSPVFWVPPVLESSRQIGRLMAILFLCNALSATLGVAQVYRPATFNPPVIPALQNTFSGIDLMYETVDGRRILRPCGLTDTPGGASVAGSAAALMGLCWALRPIAIWKRLASLGLAFLGVAVIYYTQVRLCIVMLAICLVSLTVLLTLQRNYRQAGLLVGGGALLVVGALVWVSGTMGNLVFERFGSLLGSDPSKVYMDNRGAYLTASLGEVIWLYPLGNGLGWWGVVNGMFANPNLPSKIWVEVMVPAWVQDGGFPLLIGYAGALVLTLYDSTRIALTCKDRELAYWAAVIVASNLSIVASCFSYVTFVTVTGMQFWVLSAALHAADLRVKAALRSGKSPA